MLLEEFLARVFEGDIKGLEFLDPAIWSVHHRDRNPYNNRPGNLDVLTDEEHKKLHAREGADENVLFKIVSERVRSIKRYGREETFDIEVADDPHNFVANGFVVHNTGKTTTALAAIDRAPERRILLAAFNKAIADELGARLRNPRAEAKTLHGVGFALVRRAWPGVRVDAERGFRLARRAWSARYGRPAEFAHTPIASLVSRLAGLAKGVLPLETEAGPLLDLALAHDLVPENGWAKTYGAVDVAEMALAVLGMATERDGTIDFDDMIGLPARLSLTVPAYDMVVVDEAQDMNHAQLLLALGSVAAPGRVVVIGDERQGIYGFRGADTGSIDRLKAQLDATELPLTVTRRCPRLVVALAASIVPDFEAATEAPDGEVLDATEDAMLRDVRPGDFVLSRVNAPLARICLALLREGRRARIAGRDVGKGLVALVRRSKAESLRDLLAWLRAWRDGEADKLRGNDSPAAQARVDRLYDTEETIAALADGLADVSELVARIEALFSDDGGASVVCSSIHKAKGLEADRVFVLRDTLYLFGRRPASVEEANLEYVAVTRARKTLVIVSSRKADLPEGAKPVVPAPEK